MVLERLRQETAPIHQAVEEKLQLLSPHLTLAQYVRVLQSFLAFFEPLEAVLDSACPQDLRYLLVGSARAQKLRADLQSFGADPRLRQSHAVALPEVEDSGRWLGSLYVLEGSRLGGQVISRHVEKHFRLTNTVGYSFFSSSPAEIRQHWQAVCAALEGRPQQSNQIVAGAHQTFDQLHKHLIATT